ncbi:MAG: hypothetical protein ACR5LC_08395 [Symbiopectobacterium sp.]|uniref:hypothetical protein n=1 Tax=Symbiopectobacterium sp. TaxID=2952789 RepID=UPI003F3A4309
MASYRYRDSQKNPQWVMGLVNWAKLAGPGFPASARFQATSRKRRFLGLFTLCSLMLAGYVGWNGVQTHQETLRQAAIRAAWLAQQQVQTSPGAALAVA